MRGVRAVFVGDLIRLFWRGVCVNETREDFRLDGGSIVTGPRHAAPDNRLIGDRASNIKLFLAGTLGKTGLDQTIIQWQTGRFADVTVIGDRPRQFWIALADCGTLVRLEIGTTLYVLI